MRLLPLLLAVGIAAGCSSRPDPKDYVLRVESAKPGTEYTLNGSVDLDGKKTEVKDQKTPYRYAAKGVTVNARLTSTEADCALLAGIEGTQDRELTSTATGAGGCQVRLEHTVQDRTTRMQIQVVPLPGPTPAAAPAPAPAAAPAPAPAAEAAPAPAAEAAPAPAAEAAPAATPAP